MPGETSQANRGDSLIIGSRRFGSPLTRDNPEVGIVTERVPADLPDSCAQGRRFQLALQDGLLPARTARVVGEDPVAGILPGAASAQVLQARCEARIDRQWTARTFRFRLAHLALHDGSLDENRHFVPVEIAPLEPDDLADAQAKACGHQDHGVEGVRQFSQQKTDFLCGQDARYPDAPAALAHQFDGIPVEKFPSPCVLVQKMHETANVSLALGSQ